MAALAITFNGSSTTVAALFSGVVNPGDDPDVSGHGAIGYAQGLNGLVNVHASFGADGAAVTQAETFALTLPNGNGQWSGLYTTEGQKIYLYNENGIIVGRIDADNDLAEDSQPGHFTNNDQHDSHDVAAFAITIDPSTGQTYVVQYLSLEHFSSPDAGGDISEGVSLASGTLSVAVTVTDGDGDSVTQTADVGTEIKFLDDGPTVSVSVDPHFSVVLDETPGVQSFPFGDDNDQHFFFLPSEVQSAFNSVVNQGNDPDVSSGNKDHGALSFAINGFTPALDINANYGADGPQRDSHGHITGTSYSLTLNGVSGQVDSGIQTTEGKEIYLTLENGVIVGRVDTNGDHQVTTSDPAAFAITIDNGGHVATAEWLSLHQGSADTNGDSDEAVQLASATVSATVTVTDGDGDTATASADISGQIGFEDDGPKVDISQAQTGEGRDHHDVTLSGLTLDESIVNHGGEFERDVRQQRLGHHAVLHHDTGLDQGHRHSVDAGFGARDFGRRTVQRQRQLRRGRPADSHGLQLRPLLTDDHGHSVAAGSSEGVQTNLVATDLFGSPYQGTTDAQRTIYLFHAADGSIVGRVGDDPNGDVVLHIVITGSASDPQITVEQYLPIEHPNTGSPDDSVSLTFHDSDANLGINLTVSATDGDSDTATDSKTITLADHHNSFVSIQDDGPSITSAFSTGTVIQDETPGVQTSADPNAQNDVAGADLPTGVLNLFNHVATRQSIRMSAPANGQWRTWLCDQLVADRPCQCGFRHRWSGVVERAGAVARHQRRQRRRFRSADHRWPPYFPVQGRRPDRGPL